MTLNVRPVQSDRELKAFISFPWKIYRGDPYWVPPLLEDFAARLDPKRTAFWQNARRVLWVAWDGNRPLGTIASIVDDVRVRALGETVGAFGFFECVDDSQVAGSLLSAAEDWLRAQGMRTVRGPYNPSTDSECGILVEGHHTRPALLEAHTPPYYARLVEANGYQKYRDMVARLYTRDPQRTYAELIPEKLRRVAERVAQRPDLRIRSIDMRRWADEIDRAWNIYTTALSQLPEYVPITREDFREMANGFRVIMDPRLAKMAEVNGKAVGFALALPDANEALQKVNGRLGLVGTAKLLWYSRHLSRVSFKILMMLPEFQGRGIEAALVLAVARGIYERNFREVDMSMTGEENVKSNRYQENLGFQVYRRYYVYQKELAA